uniref:rab proteins geranylgeranyltransferase component A 2-like isoform X2 n=1 Tax=Myxine glutinosa TaxID=7769 RepID=UPI00358F624E
MDDSLPDKFDVVLLGTGLPEAIVAAACARVGRSVLHLDRRDYYGGGWASFNLDGFLSWTQGHGSVDGDDMRNGVDVDCSDLPFGEEEEFIVMAQPSNASTTSPLVTFYDREAKEHSVSQNAEESTANLGMKDSSLRENVTMAMQSLEVASEESKNLENKGIEEAADEGAGEAAHEGAVEAAGQGAVEAIEGGAEEAIEGGAEEAAEESIEEDVGEVSEDLDKPREDQQKPPLNREYVVSNSRKFNIDLAPKVLFARGDLVELLCQSRVSRYLDFKSVSRVLTHLDDHLMQVPCTRADVFASRDMSVIHKRLLMKFLTFCLDHEDHPEEFADFAERPFREFMTERGLTPSLQLLVSQAVAMVSEVQTRTGLVAARRFLRSLGRFGRTPFLWSLYGAGELSQAFCRMCAVFGGIYCLRHPLRGLVLDRRTGNCTAVIDYKGKRIACDWLVVEESYVPQGYCTGTCARDISRAVLITDKSLFPSDSNEASVLCMPGKGPDGTTVNIIELSPSTMTCAPDTYLVHVTCPSSGSPWDDLAPIISPLFHFENEPESEPSRPHVIMASYFSTSGSTGDMDAYQDLPLNLLLCPRPDPQLDFEAAVEKAKVLFQRMYPEEDFCPPAPEPEDIIYGEGNTTNPSEEAPDLTDADDDTSDNAVIHDAEER